jgi:hypothetical protein
LLRGYTSSQKLLIHLKTTFLIVVSPLWVHVKNPIWQVYNTLRPLLLVLTTTPPDIRDIELRFIIYIST